MVLEENDKANLLGLSAISMGKVFDFSSDKIQNSFLQKTKIEEQIPDSFAIHVEEEKKYHNHQTNLNYIYTTTVGFNKSSELSAFTRVEESFNNARGFSAFLNLISSNYGIINRLKYINGDLNVKMLINEILIADIREGEKKALHHLFRFLFTSIKERNYKNIENLMLDNEVFTLKVIYLVAIVSITNQYKANINVYEDFFSSVKSIAEQKMEKNDFQLTFEDFV